MERLFLSAGAVKAGTTWLYAVLSGHPMIETVPIKEVHYFAQDFTHWEVLSRDERLSRMRDHFGWTTADYSPDLLERDLRWFAGFMSDPVGPDWFARLFRSHRPGSYCADFSNLSGMMRGRGWNRVTELSDHVRVLYTMRNPLLRYWSHLRFHASIFHQDLDFGAVSVAAFREMLQTPDFRPHGEFSAFIADARNHLEPHELQVTTFERFREDPVSALRQLERFLWIGPHEYDPDLLGAVVNRGRARGLPRNLAAAAEPMVMEELAALERLGVAVPDGYWRIFEAPGAAPPDGGSWMEAVVA